MFFAFALLIFIAMVSIIFVKPSAKFKLYLYAFIGIVCVFDIIISILYFFNLIGNKIYQDPQYHHLYCAALDALMILLFLWDVVLLKKTKNSEITATE